jgi:hypothetical protein
MAISELTKLRLGRAMNDPTAATEAKNAADAVNTYVEGVTPGTVTASKVLIADASLTLDALTITTLNVPRWNAPTVTAEHAVGVIGTGAAPLTSRYNKNGTIITEIKIDLKGLASKNTANDVIGLAAGGVAYIGRNVVATNGIIHRIEMICVQVPAGGDTDVNVVANAAADLVYDAAGGTTYGVDGGVWTAGKTVENLTQGLTANHYFYLTTGAGATAATYTTGQFIIRLHGHPLLA